MQHYLMTTDEHIDAAVRGEEKEAQNEAQYPLEVGGNWGQVDSPENTKAPEIPGLSFGCNSLQSHELEAAGIEPAS